MKSRTAGLSIIEVLIGVSLLSIMVVSISLPITTFFGMNRKAAVTLNATTDAQNVMEQARQLVLTYYADPQPRLTEQVANWKNLASTVTCTDLDIQGNAVTSPATCGAVTASYPTPAMRRITVVTIGAGQEEERLNLEVRP